MNYPLKLSPQGRLSRKFKAWRKQRNKIAARSRKINRG